MSIDHLSLGKLNLQNFDHKGKEKAEVAGEQFEGYLLQMMVREMRKTIPEGMFDSQAMSVFMDLFDQAIAEEMAAAGGMGFSESIQNAIKAQKGEQILPPQQAYSQQKGAEIISLAERHHVDHDHVLSLPESPQDVFQSIAKPLAKKSGIVPVSGRLSSDFGQRFHPILKEHRHHDGIDIAAPTGTPIHSVNDGVVAFAGKQGGYGNVVVIDHGDGWTTKYAHCDTIAVKVGDSVNASEVIAAVGSTGRSTGPHLHFEVERNGKNLNPLKIFGWKFK